MTKITKRALRQKTLAKAHVLSSRRFAYGLLAASALILVASFYGWWHFVASSPENVFDKMVANSLKSTAVVREVNQKQEGVQVSEKTAINTSGPHVVRSLTTLDQSGTRYEREAVGTTSDYYVRYTGISSNQKNTAGQTPNFSSVINVWGKANRQDGGDQYYNEVTLLNVIVPLGNLSAPARSDLMAQIKADDTYHFDKKAVKRTTEKGRPTYIYDVTVDLESYIKTLKKFATSAGIAAPQLESADSAMYKGQPPLKFVFKVDTWSKQLIEVQYTDNGRIEKTGSYGLRREVAIPGQTIDFNELQTRLQKLQ